MDISANHIINILEIPVDGKFNLNWMQSPFDKVKLLILLDCCQGKKTAKLQVHFISLFR